MRVVRSSSGQSFIWAKSTPARNSGRGCGASTEGAKAATSSTPTRNFITNTGCGNGPGPLATETSRHEVRCEKGSRESRMREIRPSGLTGGGSQAVIGQEALSTRQLLPTLLASQNFFETTRALQHLREVSKTPTPPQTSLNFESFSAADLAVKK